jgi:hypothetical protein
MVLEDGSELLEGTVVCVTHWVEWGVGVIGCLQGHDDISGGGDG